MASMNTNVVFHLVPTLIVQKYTRFSLFENINIYTEKWINVIFLFNDTHNTFYLQQYSVRHMVKDHSDSERRNPLPPHRLLLSINSKGSFICIIPQTG